MARFVGTFKGILLLSVVVLLATSCTRKTQDLSVNITLPVNNQKSTLSVGDQLETLIVNLHNVPGKPSPWFMEFDFEGKAFGGSVEIPGVTKGSNIIVQVLAIYENSTLGNNRLSYGAATADLSQSDTVTVNMVTQANSAERTVSEVAGRYMNAGPIHNTGRLVGYYNPPDGRPQMKVWEGVMIAGWFRAIALTETSTAASDGTNAGIDVMLEPFDGSASVQIFENLRVRNLTYDSFLVTGPKASPTEIDSNPVLYRTLLTVPPSYHSKGDGQLEFEASRNIFLGFFGPGASGTNAICLPEVNEGLRFTKVLSSGSFVPLDVQISSSSPSWGAALTGRIYGGSVESYSSHYANTGSCSYANPDHLKVNHERISHRAEDIIGILPPFKALISPGPQAQYIAGDFDQSVASQMTLTWDTLDGVDVGGAPLDGYDLFARNYSNGSNSDEDSDSDDGGGNSDVDECSRLAAKGFSHFATVNSPTATQHSFASVGSTALNTSNWHSFEYAICGFTTIAGQKKYLGNYIRSSCMGSCEDNMHTGWAAAAATATVSTNSTFLTYGGASQIQSVAAMSAPSDHLIQLNTPGDAFFSAGEEVALVIQSEGQNDACGIYQGQDLGPGQAHFARVVNSQSGSISIHSGSWVDGLIGNSQLLVTPGGGTNHCFLQAVAVPHFRTFTIAAGVTLSANEFLFSSSQGGAVALRVNGQLIMGNGSKISADGLGFAGGDATYPNGASLFGSASTAHIAGASKGFTSAYNGAGGGGGGVIGSGGANSLGGGGYADGGSAMTSASGQFVLGMGGGGGAGFSSVPDALYPGAPGGGWIFVSAQEFQGPLTSTPAEFSAQGSSDLVTTDNVAGGGGGGAVNVFFKTSSGRVSFNARGGDGGDNGGVWQSQPGGAGNGGGGLITAMLCDLNESGRTADADVTWDSTAGSNAWKVEYGDGSQDGAPRSIQTATSSDWNWFCRN